MNARTCDPDQIRQIRELWLDGTGPTEIARTLNCSRSTVYKYGPQKACEISGCPDPRRGGADNLCQRHHARLVKWGTTGCRACGSDDIHFRGLCEPCHRLGAHTATRVAAMRRAEEHIEIEVEEEQRCPLECGRPPHGPAIACPAIGLPACEGTRKPRRETAA